MDASFDDKPHFENTQGLYDKGKLDDTGYVLKEVHQINDHLVTKTSYSDGSFHEKTYNPLRQVTQEVLPTGETLRYEYDNFGSITKTTYGDGSYTESSYRNSGRQITSFRDRRGNTTTYDYNAGGQLVRITYPMGQISNEETFTYNSEGLLASRQIENSLWTYQYDPYGQLTTVKIDNTTVEERSYDAAGSLAERIYANGIREAFTFRPDGLLTSLITYGKDGRISYREEYAYNSRKDRLSTTINDEIRHYFLYDRRHKLRHRILGVHVTAPPPPASPL